MPQDPADTGRSTLQPPGAEQYRRAAESALDQLDWCVAYLHRISKPRLAEALARNRTEIRRRMR